MDQRFGKLFLVGLVGLVSTLGGCGKAEDAWSQAKTGQKKILVTFPPLYCFVKNVAGDDACVQCLLTTQGPHNYPISHGDVAKAAGADLIFANGLELDDFIDKLVVSGNNQKAAIVRVAEALPHELLLPNDPNHVHEPGGDCCHDGEFDPHVWLSPKLAQRMVGQIAEKLAALDPVNASAYKSRAEAYQQALQELQAHGAQAFKDKKNRKFIAQHGSLRYFADAFGLQFRDSIQARPGMEADGRKLAELVKLCQDEKVAAICVEPQYSRKAGEALASQLQHLKADVRLVEVDPLETAPGSPNPDPGYYLMKMRQNIDHLAKALP